MAHVTPVNNEQLIHLAKYFGGAIVSYRVLKDKKPGFPKEARCLRGKVLPCPFDQRIASPRREAG